MKLYLIVVLGSGMGEFLRYVISDIAYKYFSSLFPYGTLLVNVVGSFLLGFVLFYLDSIKLVSAELRLFLTLDSAGDLQHSQRFPTKL